MPDLTRFQRIRSLLFAPAVRPDFLEKLPGRDADAIVIDCEDATPANDAAKADARVQANQFGVRLANRGLQVVVRVNAVPTRWFTDDVAHGLVPELTAVIVPKVETVEQLEIVGDALAAYQLGHLGVMVGIETARGVANADALLVHPQVNSAYFGAEDFIADMGGVRTSTNHEVSFARSQVVLSARVAGVPVLDQIVADFRDTERFARECHEARAMGYAGKLCIHPGQATDANRLFLPSPEEVDRAHRLLAAFDEATASGVAAIDFEGQMVDEPLAAQARRIIDLSR